MLKHCYEGKRATGLDGFTPSHRVMRKNLGFVSSAKPTKKAPGKGGHHLAPFYPLTHPRGKRNDLD